GRRRDGDLESPVAGTAGGVHDLDRRQGELASLVRAVERDRPTRHGAQEGGGMHPLHRDLPADHRGAARRRDAGGGGAGAEARRERPYNLRGRADLQVGQGPAADRHDLPRGEAAAQDGDGHRRGVGHAGRRDPGDGNRRRGGADGRRDRRAGGRRGGGGGGGAGRRRAGGAAG